MQNMGHMCNQDFSTFQQPLQTCWGLRFDTSGDGVLSVEEMTGVFAYLGIKEKEANTLFEKADVNKERGFLVAGTLNWMLRLFYVFSSCFTVFNCLMVVLGHHQVLSGNP